jgi:hypothetical protein
MSRLTVDSWRTDDGCLEYLAVLLASLNHYLVDVTMESRVWETRELFHGRPVVVLFVRPLSQAVVLRVFPSKYTSAASMKPEARMIFGVAFDNACSYCLSSTFVVRCIRRICAMSAEWERQQHRVAYAKPHLLEKLVLEATRNCQGLPEWSSRSDRLSRQSLPCPWCVQGLYTDNRGASNTVARVHRRRCTQ